MQMALTGKHLLTDFALLLAVVEMPSDVFDVSSLRSQLDVTQLTLEQFAVDLVDVVLVLCEAVFVRRNEVALVTRIWLDRRVTCRTRQCDRLANAISPRHVAGNRQTHKQTDKHKDTAIA